MLIKPEENRAYPRISLHSPIRCLIRGQPKCCEASISQNVSLGGVSFTCDRFLPKETLLMLEIKLLSRVLRPIGKVAWASPLPHSDKNSIGVKFLEFEKNEMDFLQDYIAMKQQR